MAPAGPGLKVNDDKILRPFYSNSNNTLYNSAYFHTSSNELSVSIWDLGKINETRQPDDLPPTEHSERDTIQKTLLVKITLNGQLASRDRQLDRVHPTLRERDLFVSMETHALTHARIRSTLTRQKDRQRGKKTINKKFALTGTAKCDVVNKTTTQQFRERAGTAKARQGVAAAAAGWDAALSKPEEEEKHGRARGGTAGAKQQWLADGGGHRGATG
ncbi:hypothetical protein RUM44_011147 [Polyplax serrata]|uniref:Uncharacterized protein n=1 Tax=Polyplax serrata TaxID=468196 RepID=A0ABR1AP69_POLSC